LEFVIYIGSCPINLIKIAFLTCPRPFTDMSRDANKPHYGSHWKWGIARIWKCC